MESGGVDVEDNEVAAREFSEIFGDDAGKKRKRDDSPTTDSSNSDVVSHDTDDIECTPEKRQKLCDDVVTNIADGRKQIVRTRNECAARRQKLNQLVDALVGRREEINTNIQVSKESGDAISQDDLDERRRLTHTINYLKDQTSKEYTQRRMDRQVKNDDDRLLHVSVQSPTELVATQLFGPRVPCDYCFPCVMMRSAKLSYDDIRRVEDVVDFWWNNCATTNIFILTAQTQKLYDRTIKDPENKAHPDNPLPDWTLRSIFDHFNSESSLHPIGWKDRRLRMCNEMIDTLYENDLFYVMSSDLEGVDDVDQVARTKSHVRLEVADKIEKFIKLESALHRINSQSMYSTSRGGNSHIPSDIRAAHYKPSLASGRRNMKSLSAYTGQASSSTSSSLSTTKYH